MASIFINLGVDMQACPCGSGQEYANCCGVYITGAEAAPTAERLMRSRYSAYAVKAIDYLGSTLHPEHNADWDKNATQKWADESEWMELQVVSTEAGTEKDTEGWVEFIAKFKDSEGLKQHHERSRFSKVGNRWYYVDGEFPRPETYRAENKVGRNDPCPCGSGKKFKKCCG